MSNRVNARLPEPLAKHVARIVGPKGFYETPSEYIRELIRRDMKSRSYQIFSEITQGVEDIAQERYFKGSGDFKKDMQMLEQKQAEDWK